MPSRSGASWIKNLEQQTQEVVDANNEYYRARLRVIAGIDDMVADLVSALVKHNIMNNTYIFYTTDNGYHIGQHRLGPGKKCGYETDINIPMVIRGPGV
jgi:N-acetylglucosamine-6-sulfatase